MKTRYSTFVIVVSLMFAMVTSAFGQLHCGHCQNRHVGAMHLTQSSAQVAPIWTIYTPPSAIPSLNRVRPMPLPQLHYGLPLGTSGTPNFSVAPAVDGTTLSIGEPMIMPPSAPLEMGIESPSVSPIITGSIESEDIVDDSRADNFDSPSDVLLTDQSSSSDGVDSSTLQKNIEKMQAMIADLESQNQEYQLQVRDMEQALAAHNESADSKVSDTQNDDTIQKLQKEMKEAKKTAAWEVAKARKETEKAKAESTRLRKTLASTRAKLKKMTALKAKEARKNKAPNPRQSREKREVLLMAQTQKTNPMRIQKSHWLNGRDEKRKAQTTEERDK